MRADDVRVRITELRLKKGVSEYQMSYDLGHSKSYINNITSGKSLPSLPEMFAICDYFGIGIGEFFDEGNHAPNRIRRVVEALKPLEDEDLDLIMKIIVRLRAE